MIKVSRSKFCGNYRENSILILKVAVTAARVSQRRAEKSEKSETKVRRSWMFNWKPKIEISTTICWFVGGDDFNYRTENTNETIPKAIKISIPLSFAWKVNRISKAGF